MKIIYIIPQLGCGGAEVLLSVISMELISRGHEVKIICLKSHHSSFAMFPNKDMFLNSVEINVLNSDDNYHFSFRDKITKNKLKNVFNDFKPEIIHSHLFQSEIVSRSIFYPDTKWFSHCHDNTPEFKNFTFKTLFNKRLLINYLEKIYLFRQYKKNGGTHFIANSENTKQYFEKTASVFPISLLYNAIKFDKFFKTTNHKTCNDPVTLINIGSMVDKKNQTFLIDVACILKNKKINFKLLLLGDGKNRIELEKKIKYQCFSKEIIIHGNVNNVEEYLWKSDIYIHSATYEPFGLVLIEAMAAGLPVICLDGGGNRDIIEQGKNGFIIYENDPILFAEKIISLINNKDLYNSISKYAISYAKKFDIKNYVDRLIEMYRK